MPNLEQLVAVVAGGSRGAGRGIALALGEAKATVYVAGRTTRGGAPPPDGAPGTIDDTAEAVTARGGRGIAVRADLSRPAEVAALFDRVDRESGRVDLLANAVWGGHDLYPTAEAMMAAWGQPFWEQPDTVWPAMMKAAVHAYYLASVQAARRMVARGRGLIVGITDGVVAGASPADLTGPLLWDLAHATINRLLQGMSAEAKPRGVAVVTLMPGFMRTERVERVMTSDEVRRMFKYDRAESTEYVGRAVAALAADPNVLAKTGKIHFVADLAREYGFTDVDGRLVPRFDPHG
jgi:NAD(P)-dependent dehydrogenase (short-subunit alcohol dehydrogenase family)